MHNMNASTVRSAGLRRVLFLDFDGVLHPGQESGTLGPSALYMRVGPLGWLSPLARLLERHPDVEVVVHSSWRETYSLSELRDMLADFGGRVIDVTPPGPRHDSIRSWLLVRGDVQFVILDDDASEFPAPLPAELLLCSPHLGVSDEAVLAKLERWLTQSAPGGSSSVVRVAE